MTAAPEHELTLQLQAGAIDMTAGLIRGATVAQAGVQATGKFVLLDKTGNVTRDPEQAVRKLKVVTDDHTLATLIAAAAEAGGVLKIRSDHSDTLDSRAGYADNFVLVPAKAGAAARVTADLHLNDSYRDREIVLETASKTPKLIGLSIDFVPTFELTNDTAIMRIGELLAVDIVDQGAITHDGLFLSRSVDNFPKVVNRKPDPLTHMADDKKPDPTIADCMSALSALTATVGALAATVGKMSPAAAEEPAKGEELKAVLNAVNGLSEKLNAQNQTLLTLKQEQAALGLKVGAAPAAGDAAAETERLRLAAEGDKSKVAKTYLQLVDEAFAAGNGKLKKTDCHRQVMAANPAAYAAHQLSLGVYDPKKDTMAVGKA